MMSNRNKICYPKPNSSVVCVTDQGGARCFVAHGHSASNIHVKGRFINPATGQHVGSARTLMSGHHWVILFSGIQQGNNYVLQVLDLDDNVLAEVTGITVNFRVLNVTYPNSTDNTVQASFTSYGNTDSSSDVVGTL